MSNDKLAQALETAKNGLLWYRDRFPEAVDGSDDEAMSEIDAALAAHEAEKQARCCEKAKGPGDVCKDCAEASAGYSRAMAPVRDHEAEKQAGPVATQSPAPAQAEVSPGGMVLVPRELLKDAAESVDDYLSGLEFGTYDRKLLGRLKAAAKFPDATSQSPAVKAEADDADAIETERLDRIEAAERVLFEATARDHGLPVTGDYGRYSDPYTDWAWSAWQWRAAVSHVPVQNAAPPSPLSEQDKEDAELLSVLEGVLKAGRGTSGRLILDARHEEEIRSAIRAARAKKEQP